MDYVLFGMGYGASLMLLGWALRTFGPERKYKDVNPEDIDQTVLQHRWVRFIQGLGGVIAIAGVAFVLFTFVIMLVNPDNEIGAFISMVIWGFLAIAILIWCWFYVASYGVTGIWSRHSGYRSIQPASIAYTKNDPSTSRSAIVKPFEPKDKPEPLVAEIGPQLSDSSDVVVEDSINETPEDDMDDLGSDTGFDDASMDDDVNPEPEADSELEEDEPAYDFGDGTDTTVPSEFGGRSEAIRRLRERQAQSGNSSK